MVAMNILADQMFKHVYRLAVDLRALLLREQHPDLLLEAAVGVAGHVQVQGPVPVHALARHEPTVK